MSIFGTKKWLFGTLAVVFGTLALAACAPNVVSDYYLVRIDMPRLVEGAFGVRATQPKVEVKQLLSYPSDSMAVATETQREQDMLADLPQSRERTIREQSKPTDSEDFRAKREQAINEAYDQLAEQKVILMRISHVEGADLSEYLALVTEHGLNSEKVRQYIRDNQLDVFFHTIKD